MSRSKTPTLPWAIPMYQQMQESLHTNLADSSLSPRMHRAIKKGLAKLGHYYDLAKLNHFNIIATSKCLHSLRPISFSQLMDPTVCRPALRLSWFRSIDDDLTTVQRKFSSTTFKNINQTHRNQPHCNLCLIDPRNPTHFWQALLVAPRHRSSPLPPAH